MEKFDNDYFFTRHSIKPKGEDVESQEFKGISEKGVELAEQRSKEILDMIDHLDEGSVVFLGGASDAIRTKSTALVYGREIKETLEKEGRSDVLVFLPEDVEELNGYSKKVEYIIETIKQNPSKKILIDFPLYLKGISMKNKFFDKDNKPTAYTKSLLERSENDESKLLENWLLDADSQNSDAPSPEEIAEAQLNDIQRLRDFAERYLVDRPIVIGAIGHSPSLDALAVYLLNNGKVSYQEYKKLETKGIKETKIVKLDKVDDKPVLVYGDLVIPFEEEN